MINGEVYIQGGNGGGDRPEVRQLNGTFRLLSTASDELPTRRPFRGISSRRTAACSAMTRTATCTSSTVAAPAR